VKEIQRTCRVRTFRGRSKATVVEDCFAVGAGSLGLSAGTDSLAFYVVSAIAVAFCASTLVLATRLKIGKINARGAWGVLSFTFREAIRTKWLMVFGVAFFILATNLLGTLASFIHILPPRYGTLTLNEQVLVAFPFVPILALMVGATSIVDDRESGTLQYLLSNPITKSDFFLGRIAGLMLATTVVIFIGFGGAAVLTFALGTPEFSGVAILALTASLLNAVMLALALIISEVVKRRTTAIGIALFFWFLFTTVSGLDTLTYAVYWRESATAAVSLVLLDPVETSRIVGVEAAHLNETNTFGQSDYLAKHFLGADLLSVTVLSVVAWLVFLTIMGYLLFRWQDAT
jgi:ABC-type transport system involved in multi-copper enzyme maturation permease subunit